MFSSLRARLWLSYAILIWAVLSVVGLTLLVIFVQNPRLIYPEISIQLRVAGSQVAPGADLALYISNKELQAYLTRQAQVHGVSLMVVDSSQRLLASADRSSNFPVQRTAQVILRNSISEDTIKLIRGKDGSIWLFDWHTVRPGTILIAAAQPPTILSRTLFRNELFSSFFISGFIALVLSFLLALWLGGWIARPLQRMAAASKAVASGEFPSVPVHGPQEAQALATALNDMSDKVKSSQQSQRDFVANVSHELKTPVTSIQGFAQAILDGTASTPVELKQAAQIIYDEAGRMHRLVTDLLSLARLEAGTADLQREPVNLDELLRNLVQKLSVQAQQAQVSLRAEIPALPIVQGDGDWLAQVFTNLVDNAIKFTPAGGEVLMSARVDETDVQISVKDTGAGIHKEDRERIFERFYQVDRSRKGGIGRGYGLGLAIVRQIVLAHGGKIWVESEPGQGSRFVVKIPLSKSENSSQTSKNKGKS